MKVALVSTVHEEEKLVKVIEEMKTLGAPIVHAVWMECYQMYAAINGTHRLLAAKALGLVPEIEEVEYSEEMASTVDGYDGEEDYQISELCDTCIERQIVEY